jgi:hypothetical protein
MQNDLQSHRAGRQSAVRVRRSTPLRLERLEDRSLLSSWATAIGSAANDSVGGQALDPAGNMYVSGTADSGFLAKYGPDGSPL